MTWRLALRILALLALVAGCRSGEGSDGVPATPSASPTESVPPVATPTPGETPAPPPTPVPNPDLTLTISEPNVLLPLAEETTVHLVLRRATALTGLPVEITVEGLPAGVTADPLTISPGDYRVHADLLLRASPGTSIAAPHPMRFVATVAGAAPSSADLQLVRRGYPGTLDVEFGEGGIHDLGLPFSGRTSQVKRDGTKFVSGWEDTDVLICKFLADGAPDDSFGTAGRVQVDFGARPAWPGALVLSGSTIWVGGQVAQRSIFLLKLDSNGGLDTAWGEGGKSVLVPPDDLAYGLNDLFVLGDGSMVAVGSDYYDYRGYAYRITSVGALDPAFGEAGRAPICGCSPASIARDAAGRFVSTGASSCEGGGFYVTRFLLDGSPDATFGADGCVRDGSDDTFSREVAFQGDDLLVAGALIFPEHSSTTDFALVRYDETGTRVAGFGANGIARKYIGSMEVCGNFDDTSSP